MLVGRRVTVMYGMYDDGVGRAGNVLRVTLPRGHHVVQWSDSSEDVELNMQRYRYTVDTPE